jgi:deferrochelatase/peroxidase EfeB
MVLRAGYKVGPARPWDIVAAFCGVFAVAIFAIFVVLAPRPDGYSAYSDTISRLGAFGAPAQWWFTTVNLVEALLIPVFAYGVQRRVPVGLVGVLLLGAVAPGSLVVSYPCSGVCDPRAIGVHNAGASYTGVMIVLMMVAVGWGAFRYVHGWLRPATMVASAANVSAFLLLLLSIYGPLGGVGLWERLFWATAYLWVLMAAASILEATQRRPRVPGIDPSVAQGQVLSASRALTEAIYLLGAVRDLGPARQWVAETSRSARDLPHTSVTLAFTHQGLKALDFGYRDNPSSAAFVTGMRPRAAALGDQGGSAPEEWEEPWRSHPVHVLVWIEARNRRDADAALALVTCLPGAGGLEFYPPQVASAGTSGRRPQHELLGFRDGISQPWLRFTGWKEPSAEVRGGGVLDPFGELRPVAAGEFVLGVEDESGDVAPLPHPKQVFDRGTYLVVRKLVQDEGLDLDATVVAGETKGGPSFSELLMGRRRHGAPLAAPGHHCGLNHFAYSADPEGLRCPLGAHVRRANPRDALGFGSLLSARHRIIRRGKVFREHDSTAWVNGLMFLALNARIEDQFEFIQRLWLNDGNRQRIGTTSDTIAGSSGSTGPIVLQSARGPEVYRGDTGVVRTRGGEYFFVPSRAGLEALTTLLAE